MSRTRLHLELNHRVKLLDIIVLARQLRLREPRPVMSAMEKELEKGEFMGTPRVGDIIYIGGCYYLGHGRDDFAGGKATVTEVEEVVSGGRAVPFVCVRESPNDRLNWELLEPEQEQLKAEYGDQWAHPEPDLRPEFNED